MFLVTTAFSPWGYTLFGPVRGGPTRKENHFSGSRNMKGYGFHYLKYERVGNLSLWSVKGPNNANRRIIWL